MERYFDWLMAIVGGPGEYKDVIDVLWSTEYWSDIPNDENRANDGLELRYFYEEETGFECEKNGACTVLEMMIALANRMENAFFYDPKVGNRTNLWFWEMFYNAGFANFGKNGQKKWPFAHFLQKFLARKSGTFFFEIDKKPENWAKIEVWKQVCAHVSAIFE